MCVCVRARTRARTCVCVRVCVCVSFPVLLHLKFGRDHRTWYKHAKINTGLTFVSWKARRIPFKLVRILSQNTRTLKFVYRWPNTVAFFFFFFFLWVKLTESGASHFSQSGIKEPPLHCPS